jgi:hypothetical protein
MTRATVEWDAGLWLVRCGCTHQGAFYQDKHNAYHAADDHNRRKHPEDTLDRLTCCGHPAGWHQGNRCAGDFLHCECTETPPGYSTRPMVGIADAIEIGTRVLAEKYAHGKPDTGMFTTFPADDGYPSLRGVTATEAATLAVTAAYATIRDAVLDDEFSELNTTEDEFNKMMADGEPVELATPEEHIRSIIELKARHPLDALAITAAMRSHNAGRLHVWDTAQAVVDALCNPDTFTEEEWREWTAAVANNRNRQTSRHPSPPSTSTPSPDSGSSPAPPVAPQSSPSAPTTPETSQTPTPANPRTS